MLHDDLNKFHQLENDCERQSYTVCVCVITNAQPLLAVETDNDSPGSLGDMKDKMDGKKSVLKDLKWDLKGITGHDNYSSIRPTY